MCEWCTHRGNDRQQQTQTERAGGGLSSRDRSAYLNHTHKPHPLLAAANLVRALGSVAGTLGHDALLDEQLQRLQEEVTTPISVVKVTGHKDK